jgi:hypothetical protein
MPQSDETSPNFWQPQIPGKNRITWLIFTKSNCLFTDFFGFFEAEEEKGFGEKGGSPLPQ